MIGVERAVTCAKTRDKGFEAGDRGRHEGHVEGGLGPDAKVCQGEGGIGGKMMPGKRDEAGDEEGDDAVGWRGLISKVRD